MFHLNSAWITFLCLKTSSIKILNSGGKTVPDFQFFFFFCTTIIFTPLHHWFVFTVLKLLLVITWRAAC